MMEAINLDAKLNKYFPGRVVRKDLTNMIKQGANVPTYVLEYLLACIVPPMTMNPFVMVWKGLKDSG